jgi:predicted nucleotide-binding protein (sugar kinase/HSP70/actin superfamily)
MAYGGVKTPSQQRKIWVPQMSDHAYVLAATYRSCGFDSEVLPEPDDESLKLGNQFCSGRECMPCFVTTGDIVRRVQQPDFDASKEAFVMATSTGPCKFGQYHQLQRLILNNLGHYDVELITPSSKTSYQDVGVRFFRTAWRGLLAVECLDRLVRETRPYEINKGQTDEVYQRCFEAIVAAVEVSDDAVKRYVGSGLRREFAAIPVDRSVRRPIIGLVGEIYLRANPFSNSHIVRRAESLGAEVWVAPLSEWFFYTAYRYKEDSIENRRFLDIIKGIIRDKTQLAEEHKMLDLIKDMVLNNSEPTTEQTIEYALPYMHPSFGGEAILSVGKAIDYIKKGVCGILNVTPFACMPGVIVGGIARKLREDFDNVPWLDLMFDGQENTNIMTRLEAFMYQAKQYQIRLRDRDLPLSKVYAGPLLHHES